MNEILTHGSLFSGIGGIDLGLERTEHFKTIWHSEIDDYASKVLKKHWPETPNLGNITEIDWEKVNVPDIVSGGFPCQPYSYAGERKGDEDERWLWPEFFRCICQIKPRYVLVENVPGLLSIQSGRVFGQILGDLAKSGYDAEWNIISAANVGAWHRRDRVFIIAYPHRNSKSKLSNNEGEGQGKLVSNTHHSTTSRQREYGGKIFSKSASERLNLCRQQNRGGIWRIDPASIRDTHNSDIGKKQEISEKESDTTGTGKTGRWATQSHVGRVADGVPSRVDRLRSLGNAVVPQVAHFLGELIYDFHLQLTQEESS